MNETQSPEQRIADMRYQRKRCVVCGHRATINGFCQVGVDGRPLDVHGYRQKCGCRCVFTNNADNSQSDVQFLLSLLSERDKRIEQLESDLNEVVERHTTKERSRDKD